MTDNYKLTKKGYVRARTDTTGRLRMEHDLVWEQFYGEIPQGMQVHHKDGNKENNDISNLQLVTPLEHKRIHEGCVIKNGVWYKPCKMCREYKPCNSDFWYFSRGWINGKICKSCFIAKSLKERKEREAKGWKRKSCPKKRFADYMSQPKLEF